MTSAAQTHLSVTFRDYLRIARLDHGTKQIFILPGIVLALLLRGAHDAHEPALALTILVGLIAATAIASANYVINEWLDRGSDVFHPEKSQRAAVQLPLSSQIVYAEYAILLTLGLALAATVNTAFLVVASLFAISGLIYNVEPIRSKDRPYVDVLTESMNNPLRLTLGWTMVDPATIPPSSLLLAFWFGGAFLMNSKRLAEYRDIVHSDGAEILSRYRRSFAYYDEARLSVANLVYALLCAFSIAVFLIKYRIEYLLLFPPIVGLFAVYYAMSLQPNSIARKPEKLYLARPLIMLVGTTAIVFMATTLIDLPLLERLSEQHYIVIGSAEAG